MDFKAITNGTLILLSFIFDLILTFSLFIFGISPILIIGLTVSTYILIYSYKAQRNYYLELYTIYLHGDKHSIDKLNQATLKYAIKSCESFNQAKNVTTYYFTKNQHPTLSEFNNLDIQTFPKKVFENYTYIIEQLKKEKFIVSKEVNYSSGDKNIRTFLVDETNKQFAIVEGHNIELVKYNQLNSSVLSISSNDVQTSATPSQYRTEVHTTVVIKLKNNLQKPVITIEFLNLHKTPFSSAAHEIIGVLEYIEEFNRNNPSF